MEQEFHSTGIIDSIFICLEKHLWASGIKYRLLNKPEAKTAGYQPSSFLPVNKTQEAVEVQKNA